MNKYLKHLLWLGLLGLSSSAYAEGGCPNGMTPVNNGQNWTCIPGGNDSPTQQQAAPSLPRPTGHWVKTWGESLHHQMKVLLVLLLVRIVKEKLNIWR